MARALPQETVQPIGATTAAAVAFRSGGRLNVTVIAKATFAFARDAAMTRTLPQPIFEADVHHGNHPTRSVRFASDLAPYLGRAEVLFTGHAHAPGGAPVDELTVRLGLFDEARVLLDKMLIVRKRPAFTKVPVVYERAFGGAGSQDNPIGLGADDDGQEPSLLDPRDARRPIGLGPISSAWPSRRRLLGAVPRQALESALAEIPDGFDWAYFQSAPADQRIERLRGDEWLVMDALHPEHARLRMRLPGARGRARVFGLSASGTPEGQPLELTADTLRIDGDERCCTLTWRASFPVPNDQALSGIRVLAGVEMPGQPLDWPDAPSLPAPGPPVSTPPLSAEPKKEILATAAESTMALPGATMAFPPSAPSVSAPVAIAGLPAREDAPAATLAFVPVGPAAVRLKAAMPFQTGGAPVVTLGPISQPAQRVDTGTVMAKLDAQALAALRKPLPFDGEGPSPAETPALATPAFTPALALALAPAPEEPAPKVDEPSKPAAAAPQGPGQPAKSPYKEGPPPDDVGAASPGGGREQAPSPPARPKARRVPAPRPAMPGASPELKKGLYGKFSGKA